MEGVKESLGTHADVQGFPAVEKGAWRQEIFTKHSGFEISFGEIIVMTSVFLEDTSSPVSVLLHLQR